MSVDRRDFLKLASMGSLAMMSPKLFAAKRQGEIRAMLLHLGSHSFEEIPVEAPVSVEPENWQTITNALPDFGVNTIVVDLAEAVRYPSHPELAVKGSWEVERLRAEIRRLRTMGLEVIPKLNFSCGHNFWLKEYRRMVSTGRYYQVCEDLTRDIAEIFDRPRFFHIGFDEECGGVQTMCDYCVVRQGDLFYQDFSWHAEMCEKYGMRPMAWADMGWGVGPEAVGHQEFLRRCPKSILLCNWYYDDELNGFCIDKKKSWMAAKILKHFQDLDKNGFDQLPCGSNWLSPKQLKAGLKTNESIKGLIRFCRENIASDRLCGFMMAPWAYEPDQFVSKNLEGLRLFGEGLALHGPDEQCGA